MYFRVPALFIGNGNEVPYFRHCALFSDGETLLRCAISDGTITATDNGDGTANIRITDVRTWGNYYLIVIVK